MLMNTLLHLLDFNFSIQIEEHRVTGMNDLTSELAEVQVLSAIR